MNPHKRMQIEFHDILKLTDAEKQGIDIALVEDDLMHLLGIIAGPPSSVYEDGKFKVDIRIGDKYPFQAPAVKFVTRIWHPNISSATGYVCEQ